MPHLESLEVCNGALGRQRSRTGYKARHMLLHTLGLRYLPLCCHVIVQEAHPAHLHRHRPQTEWANRSRTSWETLADRSTGALLQVSSSGVLQRFGSAWVNGAQPQLRAHHGHRDSHVSFCDCVHWRAYNRCCQLQLSGHIRIQIHLHQHHLSTFHRESCSGISQKQHSMVR